MRILFLTHRMPYPPNKGDKIRSFHILEHLRAHHEVRLASVVDDAADLAHVAEIEKRVVSFVYARVHPRLHKVLALRSLLQRRPITVTYFYSAALQRRIDALLDASDVDLVFCYSSPMAEYVFRSRHAGGKLRRALRVMDLIDVDSYKWRQYAESAPSWQAWVYRHEARYLADYEARIAREFDRLFVVSEQERRYFPGDPDAARLGAMSNGVDLEFFAPTCVREPPRPTLVFTGVMDYRPNVEGVTWFADEVLPLIRAAIPDVRMQIVGSRPTRDVQALAARPGVEVTGFVPDIREYVSAASVCVVPLRIARGIQNKVLEAMAMGRPVVTTPQAFEGIEARPGEDIVVAEGEQAFADAVVALLRDPARAATIGARARACVERHYSWRQNLAQLDQIRKPAA